MDHEESLDEYIERLVRQRDMNDYYALQDNLDSKEEWS